jgi:hypothetical protein
MCTIKSQTHRAIESFTHLEITSEEISRIINQPMNAINIQGDAHDSYDSMAWGIEATLLPDGKVSDQVHSLQYELICIGVQVFIPESSKGGTNH